MLSVGYTIFRWIIVIIFLIFIVGVFVYCPLWLLRSSFVALIGRPIGSGWQRLRARVQEEELPDIVVPNSNIRMQRPPVQYAVYDVDGQEYKVLLKRRCKKEFCKVYARKDNPNIAWLAPDQSRLTALLAVVLVGALWAGLVYVGFIFADMIRS